MEETKEEKVIIAEEVIATNDNIGAVLNLVADENNPVGDGREYKEDE